MKRMKKIFVCLLGAAVLFAACASKPAAADMTGFTSYYVRSDGNDKNPGTSEAAPFKTLARAVEAAAKTPVKQITVIGTLTGQTDIQDSGDAEILITGKADSPEAEKAFLKPAGKPGEHAIVMAGVSNIRLEHITIAGYSSNGIQAVGALTLTVGQGAVITGNGGNKDRRANFGGGILVIGGTLVMQGDAVVTGNYAGNGGGVGVEEGSFLMKDDARITGNTADNTSEFQGGGGVAIEGGTVMTMRGNAYIADNKARSGGGVRIYDAELIMQDNAVIKGNAANDEDNLLYGGGGIYSVDGNITLRDNSAVTGNSAAYGGGVYRKVSALTEEGGTVSGNTSTVRDGDVYENNA